MALEEAAMTRGHGAMRTHVAITSPLILRRRFWPIMGDRGISRHADARAAMARIRHWPAR